MVTFGLIAQVFVDLLLQRPQFDFSGSLKYIDNQYAIVYLMRF